MPSTSSSFEVVRGRALKFVKVLCVAVGVLAVYKVRNAFGHAVVSLTIAVQDVFILLKPEICKLWLALLFTIS